MTVPLRLASATVMLLVEVVVLPTDRDKVIVPELNLLVSEAKALETLRCSWAIWLTEMLFEPALAEDVEVAEKAFV